MKNPNNPPTLRDVIDFRTARTIFMCIAARLEEIEKIYPAPCPDKQEQVDGVLALLRLLGR